MKLELVILGNGAATPLLDRPPTSVVLLADEQPYLLDCGEGTQTKMLEFGIKKSKINQIFITHLHGDHVFGLIGLLTSYSLNQRQSKLQVFSPPGLEKIIKIQLEITGSILPFEIEFFEIIPDSKKKIFEDSFFEIFSIPLKHRVPTSGYLFLEKPKKRKINTDILKKYNLSFSDIKKLKDNKNITLENGQILTADEATFMPSKSKSFAYCTDTIFLPELSEMIQNVDVLFHETTYLNEDLTKAESTFHSTTFQAATIALNAKAKMLITGHYSARYKNLKLIDKEIKSIFPNSFISKPGDRFSLE
jgi:ribonuclease Z